QEERDRMDSSRRKLAEPEPSDKRAITCAQPFFRTGEILAGCSRSNCRLQSRQYVAFPALQKYAKRQEYCRYARRRDGILHFRELARALLGVSEMMKESAT
ncbi:MAG: hypothetical protein ABFS30_09430, partial [Pseudomonadota bacterium]